MSIGMAHTESFGVEAAAVNAAAYAQAFAVNSSIQQVLDVAQRFAQDGSGLAPRAVLLVTNPTDDLGVFVEKNRKAVFNWHRSVWVKKNPLRQN